MKNKRKVWAPAVAGLATCSMVLPLAMSATSCSCSKFASTSVLDGNYIPDFDPYDAGVDAEGYANFVNIPQGEDIMLKAYIHDKKMPAKEHRWMASGVAYYLTYYASLLNNELGYEAIKVNKYNADLKNFKVEDQRTGRVSYNISQDIDVTLDIQPGELPFGSNLKLDSLAGNIRLAWNHKVNNMPLGIFDIGTDDYSMFSKQIRTRAPYGDKPFEDMTIWFVAPDMSEVPAGDKTWSLNLDFLVDADVSVNGDKLIDIDHEYDFTFDKYSAWGVEELVKALSKKGKSFNEKAMGLAYILERFIPLCSGWASYYLSQCHHMDHIITYDKDLEGTNVHLNWQTPFTYQLTPGSKILDIDTADEKKSVNTSRGGKVKPLKPQHNPIDRQHVYAYTKQGTPAFVKYELADASYGPNDIFTLCLGLNTQGGGFTLKTLLQSILKGNLIPDAINTTSSIAEESFGHILDVKFDWDPSYFDGLRPGYGESLETMGLGYDTLLPVVMTKDWVAFGQPFTLVESGSLYDMYEAHNPKDGSKPTTEVFYMDEDVSDAYQVLNFAIDQSSYEALTSDIPLIKLKLDAYGSGDEVSAKTDPNTGYIVKSTTPDDDGYYCLETSGGVLGYEVNIPVWIDEVNAGVSQLFTLTAEIYEIDPETKQPVISNKVTTAPFQFATHSGEFDPGKDDPIPIVVSAPQWNTSATREINIGSPDSEKKEIVLTGAIVWPGQTEQTPYPVSAKTDVGVPQFAWNDTGTYSEAKARMVPSKSVVSLSGNMIYDLHIPFNMEGSAADKPKFSETVGLRVMVGKEQITVGGGTLNFIAEQIIDWNDTSGDPDVTDRTIGIIPTQRNRSLSDVFMITNKENANYGNDDEGVYQIVGIYDDNGNDLIDKGWIIDPVITNGTTGLDRAFWDTDGKSVTIPGEQFLNFDFDYSDDLVKELAQKPAGATFPITIKLSWYGTKVEQAFNNQEIKCYLAYYTL